jgi:hypothetical protein
MHRRIIASLVFACVPLVADAQTTTAGWVQPTYTFDLPDGWSAPVRTGTRTTLQTGVGVDFQVIVIAADRSSETAEATARRLILNDKAAGKVVTDDGPTQTCDGQDAYAWTTAETAGKADLVEHNVVTAVTGGIARGVYVRSARRGDRLDALETMKSICRLPFAAPAIPGWTATAPVAGLIALQAPDGSSFYGSFSRMQRPRFPGAYSAPPNSRGIDGPATTCTNGELVRTTYTTDKRVLDVARGFVRGFAYVLTYERDASHPADPNAEDELTAICRSPAM